LTQSSSPHVELAAIGKRFGGIQALKDIDLEIERGTVHALVGENGAGKSTLGKIIGGAVKPDDGELRVNGKAVDYKAPRDALHDGITVIAQEIALVPGRSVIENVYLGIEPRRLGLVSRRSLRRDFDELAGRAAFDLPPNELVGELPLAEQQQVEILRGLARKAQLIVFDEPTASLSLPEAENLFAAVRRLRDGGTTVIYVSHNLGEVLSLADTVTVLKDGKLVRTAPAATESPDSLITSMLGRTLEATFPDKTPVPSDAPIVLEVKGLGRPPAVRDVTLQIRAGEILGLAGLIGAGRSELGRLIFGADKATDGQMLLSGEIYRPSTPRRAVRSGIAMVPESRKTQGLIMGRSVQENVTLSHLGAVCSRGGILWPSRENSRAKTVLDHVDVRPVVPRSPVSSLSGGNQQKVAFAKWLIETPKLLIADEPTRGVDVGAKRAIYDLLTALAREGLAVLLISSDVDEVLGLAHRVMVMREGSVVAELEGDSGPDQVLGHAFGRGAVNPSQSF
jgi:simple sugar transport system ATP-binding protein/ribose transport system ATP-binding protein